MTSIRRRLMAAGFGLAAAVGLALTGATAAMAAPATHAAISIPAAHAATGLVVDDSGSGYPIACTMAGEGGLAGTVTSNGSQITLVSVDGGMYTQFKCASGDCLKYNSSSGGYVYGNQACNSSTATYWQNINGGVWDNAWCESNGETCDLSADAADAGPVAPTDLMAYGGTHPAWTHQWSTP